MAGAGAQRIGPTAHYTAYVWKRLALPHAEHFATPTGAVLYWGFFALGEWTTRLASGVPSMRDYLEHRHRLIDSVVEVAAPDLVVEIGAGLTRRAVTWAADRGVRAVELDLPAMAAVKRAALARMPAAVRHRLAHRHAVIDADVLAPDFGAVLGDAIGEARRPVVIAEGLLSYFDLPDRCRVLAGVAEALRSRQGGALVCDLHTATAQAQVGSAAIVLRSAIRALTRRRHALDPFADEAALFHAFSQAGFGRAVHETPDLHASRDSRIAATRSPALIIRATVESTVFDGISSG
jgi:O-methyltransferase involved in polyketide biosynthesis